MKCGVCMLNLSSLLHVFIECKSLNLSSLLFIERKWRLCNKDKPIYLLHLSQQNVDLSRMQRFYEKIQHVPGNRGTLFMTDLFIGHVTFNLEVIASTSKYIYSISYLYQYINVVLGRQDYTDRYTEGRVKSDIWSWLVCLIRKKCLSI